MEIRGDDGREGDEIIINIGYATIIINGESETVARGIWTIIISSF